MAISQQAPKVSDANRPSGSSGTCKGTAAEIKWTKDMGCCLGTMLIAASMGDSSSSGTTPSSSSSKTEFDAQDFIDEAAACNVQVSLRPCGGGSMVQYATTETDVVISGVSKAQFNRGMKKNFCKGVAKTAGVKASDCVVTSVTDTKRRSGVEVKSSLTLTGKDVAKQNTINAKLANTATLQTNIKANAGGTALSGASVSSASVKKGAASDASVSTKYSALLMMALATMGLVLSR